MSLSFRPRFSPLPALAVLGAAGVGASFGGMPELSRPVGSVPLVSLALMASVAGWMWWRNRGPSGRFSGLALQPLARGEAQLEGVTRFSLTSPQTWQARQGAWCLELTRGPATNPAWSLVLRPSGFTTRHWPLAHATTLDGLLSLARRLASRAGLALPEGAPEVAAWLEGDVEFVLPAARQQIMALAEGGYALRGDAAWRAISPQTADAMLSQGSPVPTGGC